MNADRSGKSRVRRVISLTLVLVFVLSLMPTVALAEGNPSGLKTAVESGRSAGSTQVRVVVENSTFTPESPDWEDRFWYGKLVDRWVDIDGSSTAMSCVVAALTEAGYSQTGAENNYISEIAGLSEFDGGSMSGWMGTLNDWFTNEGFGAYTVADGKLSDGDIIHIVYTLDYGEDCGGSWGNNDTSLRSLYFSAGTMDKTFSAGTTEYTLTVPQDVDSIYVTPTAANKNFQARIFVGGTEYKRTAAVPVSDGTVVTVKIGDPSWPSMNEGAVATTYSVTIVKEHPAAPTVEVSVTAANAASAGLFAETDSGMTANLLSGEGQYSASVPEGSYILALYSETELCLGTILLPVSEANSSFTVYSVSVTCGNEGWICGTDYTVEPRAMSGGSEATAVREITLGEGGSSFLCLDGDNVSATIVPSAARKAEGYAPAAGANVVTGAGFAQIAATCGKAAILEVTYPYEDSNNDAVNDYVLEVGQLTNYYIFSYIQPDETGVPENGMVKADFTGLSQGSYYYRVSNPVKASSVSYGTYITCSLGTNAVVVTTDDLCENDGNFSKSTVDRSFSNAYDVADLYLGVDGDYQGGRYDGAAGHLKMNANEDATLYAYRNWLPVNSVTANIPMFPDYHVQVVTMEGSDPVTVTENLENNSGKHSFNIHANGTGTAVLLVTYDALSFGGAVGGSRYSAIWPENTGVIVVTVGKSTASPSCMTINESLNTGIANKLVVDRIDAELDVLYYAGTQGASYSFKPEAGTEVSMSVCGYGGDGKMTFGAFSGNGVSTAEDGTVTLSGLTQGKTIVRLVKDGSVSYQVLRAVHTDVVVTNSDNEKIVDTANGVLVPSKAVVPGEKLSVQYSTLYHPANKLSGIYNMSAMLNVTDDCENTFAGTGNQYNFASVAGAHKVDVTVPASAGDSYSIAGTIKANGFGSYYGYHRLLKYEDGKTANFSALQQTGYFGQLPEISFDVAKPLPVNVTVFDGNDSAVEDYVVSISCGGDAMTVEDGVFTGFPGKTYDYELTVPGHPRVIDSFVIPEDAFGNYTVKLTVPELNTGAWNGTAQEEPAQTEGVYQIGSGAELAWFASKVNDGTASSSNAILTADISLSNMDWTPIGTSSNKYSGMFDGCGHYITGLYINSSSTYQGLFGYVNNGTIRNLGVSGQVKGGQYTAGIAAYLDGTGKVESCVNSVNVTGGKNTGGIAGFQNTSAPIENCYNTGSVNGAGNQLVGGISGGGKTFTVKDTITNCYNIGRVYSTNTYCGAINGSAQVANITNTYYLAGSWTGTKTSNVNKSGTSKTSDELKALAPTLGEAFTPDTSGINGGYPVLVWQAAAHEHSDADFNGICDECSETIGTLKTASVDYTSQFSGAYLHAPKSGVSVSSNTAELYGFEDGISYLEGVSVLDILIQAHTDVYGAAFTQSTASAYLVMGEYGSPDTMFAVPGTTACGGFFLNNGYANDGTESEYGGYNGTLVTTQPVKDGDLVEFFFYEDENYGDTYNWFIGENGYSRSFEATAGIPIELTLKGFFAMNAYVFKDAAEMVAAQNALKVSDAQIYVIDMNTGAKTALAGAVTDENGKVSLTFSEAGAYVIAAYGTDDCTFTQLLSMTEIAVAEASAQEYAIGDVNADGEINSVDAALAYAFHNGKTQLTAEQLSRADVNGDNAVNSTDAAMIYAYHNGKITQFS